MGRKTLITSQILAPGKYRAGSHFNQTPAPHFTSISGAITLWLPATGAVGAAARTLRASGADSDGHAHGSTGATAICVNLIGD